jgi:phosphoribosylformimino-5-aminoimidazole carboxamide ribotide isomerase
MRIIPVIDLLNGQAVHAIKGERKQYKPVKSVLCNSSEPLIVAEAFHIQLGFSEIYVADLDAIQSSGQIDHKEILSGLVRMGKMHIMLDAGISTVENARKWLDAGVQKIVIGSETLPTWNAIRTIPEGLDRKRLVFSLDLRAGKIQSSCPVLSSMEPLEAMEYLDSAGWKEVILLDLARVGSGEGLDTVLIKEIRSNFPEIQLFAGGGIATIDELLQLKSLGITGVLLATALHKGTIQQSQLPRLL